MPTEIIHHSSQPAAQGGDTRIAWGLSTLVIAIIFAGFAKNFYLRVWFGTRPLILTAWVHGIVMTAWLALFTTQVSLVYRRRLDLHRTLGQWSVWGAALVVAVGIVTIAIRTRLMFPTAKPSTSALVFVAFDGLSLLLFGALVALAWKNRLRPAVHRRLMVMSMVALLPPAFGRLVAYVSPGRVEIFVLGLMLVTTLLFVIVDALRSHRLQPASWVPGLLILLANGATCAAQLAT